MNSLLPYGAALLLGSVHALEPDHMAAVTAFAIRRPAPLAAVGFGVRWAIGHGSALLGMGVLLLTIGLVIPDAAAHWLERGVGFVLIALGAWTLRSSANIHAHAHRQTGGGEHVHLHPHAGGHRHDHRHAATLVGALHGLAGAAPALALLNLTRAESILHGVSALLVFGLGTALGMGTYALFAGFIAGRAAVASEALARGLARLTGLGAICIGLLWLLQ